MSNLIKKGTIYVGSMIGYYKIEAFKIEHFFTAYAQYSNAVCVVFLPPYETKRRYILKGYNPKFVILDGWGHPDTPGESSYRIENDSKFETRRILLDSEFADEVFESFFSDYVNAKNPRILADYRSFVPSADRDYRIKPRYKEFEGSEHGTLNEE